MTNDQWTSSGNTRPRLARATARWIPVPGVMLILCTLTSLCQAPKRSVIGTGLLPSIEVGLSQHAVPDVVLKGEFRPMIQVQWDGRIKLGGERLFNHRQRQDAQAIGEWLRNASRRMQRRSYSTPNGSVLLPSDELLIRADHMAPFAAVEWLMSRCAVAEIKLWRIQFAAKTFNLASHGEKPANTIAEGRIELFLPGPRTVDMSASLYCPVETTVQLKVMGTKRCPGSTELISGGSPERFEYGPNRLLSYTLGPHRGSDPAQIQAAIARQFKAAPTQAANIHIGEGVTCGEALGLINVFLDVGWKRLRFTGPTYD